MKYGPGERAVPDLHSSGFNLLSALGCGRVGIPFFFSFFFVGIEKEGGGVGEKLVLSCTKARHICLEECVVAYKDSLTLVSVGNPQSADAFVWKCCCCCFFAEMDTNKHK